MNSKKLISGTERKEEKKSTFNLKHCTFSSRNDRHACLLPTAITSCNLDLIEYSNFNTTMRLFHIKIQDGYMREDPCHTKLEIACISHILHQSHCIVGSVEYSNSVGALSGTNAAPCKSFSANSIQIYLSRSNK